MENVKQVFDSRNRLAWVILLFSLGLTLLVWKGLRIQMTNNEKQQFELHVRDVTDAIEERMRQQEQILRGGVGLFDASQTIGRDEWRTYIERLGLKQNYPGIQGVGFSQVIKPAELNAHIAAVRRQGFPQYTVRPPGERPLYTSIVYLEPFSGRNLAAFGFDMMSEATRASAMRAAVDKNTAAITHKVKLVQETQGKEQAGFLMYLPVYRKNLPLETVEERWAALQGYVYSPYRMDDLMNGILGSNNVPNVNFSIFDGETDANATRMYSSTDVHLAAQPEMRATRVLNVYGNSWTVRLESRPEFEADFRSVSHSIILLLGVGISLSLFVSLSLIISQRERAEKHAESMTREIRDSVDKLKLSESRTQAILDNVLDGIITINSVGSIESFNKAAEQIFGYSAPEVIGNNVKLLMPEPYHSQHDGYLNNFMTTGKRKIIGLGRQVVGRRKDGSTFPMDLAVSEMRIGENRIFTGIVRDITERVKVEQMKSEFISTVSHELRTPLTSIRGSLALIVGGVVGELPATAKPLVEIAHKNSERLILLVNDILDMEKIEAGRMEFDMQPVKLMQLLKQALEGNRAYGDQFKVSYEIASELPDAMLKVDANRLMQVFANLLSNAAKFSHAGGKVSVAVERSGERIRVSVTDNGSGIPAEFKSRIFKKFAQADSSDTRKKGGTGLGLSITKAMIEQMGGSIGFTSQPDVQTTFYVEFPELKQETESADADAETMVADRVLVCEDDQDTAQLLRMMLEHAGLEVDTAYSADQAKQLLAQGRYQLMTLDLEMPEQRGLSLLRELRTRPATAKLPVIVVSLNAPEDGKNTDHKDLGIADWITKPIQRDSLITAVNRVVKHGAEGKPRILHVEDDADVFLVVKGIASEAALEQATTLAEARKMLAQRHYDLVILDIALPDGSGMELLPQLKKARPRIPVLVFSADEMTQEVAQRVDALVVKSRSDNAGLLTAIRQLLGNG